MVHKLREKNEELWINTVFKDILLHDCPFIPNMCMEEHEQHNFEFDQYLQFQESFDSNFKVINSFAIKDSYVDRDNPKQIDVNAQFDEQSWTFDGQKWKPPDNKGATTVSPTPRISMLQYIHHIQSYYPLVNKQQHIEETDNNVVAQIKAFNNPTDSQRALILQQSDTGANACATNDLHSLFDVVFIKPIQINSAHKQAQMSMKAVGRIRLRTIDGTHVTPLCYYSPDIYGTIISPTAIVQEYRSKYSGFQKVCDCANGKGYLQFDSVDESVPSTILPLFSTNNLWYHHKTEPSELTTSSHQNEPTTNRTINKLTKAASFELWHQRLCHPGNNIMASIHNHAIGIPKLNGNSFWKCPSCMESKCQKTYHTKSSKSLQQKKWKKATLQELLYEEPEEKEDDMYIPGAVPGQHFHCDFGFMRSKSYQQKDEEGKMQTSIDGKRAYLLIIDRCTRYMWVYIANSKRPPVQFCKSVLNKFKSSTKHRTVRCDQGELASSNDFKKMLQEEQFSLQVTGSNNSKQNGMAERPHRTLAQMVRCTLQGAGLGPVYWLYALQHCVYVKNRLPHKALKKSPYELLTGNKPDLRNLRVFGSRVVAQTPRSRTGKLDKNRQR